MSHDVTDFAQDVLEQSRTVPVLVDFWAAWCAPCRVLGPVLERLADEANGRWTLAKVDTERFPEVAQAYGVQGIPNVQLFSNGAVVDGFVGALPEAEVRRWLDRALPSPNAARVLEARALVERGAFDEAAAILSAVLEAEPASDEARLALAEALLHADPARVPETLATLDRPEWHDGLEALRTLAVVASAPDRPDELPEGAARERFVAGARALRKRDFDAALEAFIDVLRRDRGYAGGLARDACRALFVLLGGEHPLVERHHRAFSSALH